MITDGMSSLTGQVGGTHYTKMGMQPFVFTLINGWDAAAHSILKYIARHHSKNPEKGEEDLDKAIHICDIRADIYPVNTNNKGAISLYNGRYVVPVARDAVPETCLAPIAIEAFISANELGGCEADALTFLDRWVRGGNMQAAEHAAKARTVQLAISQIIRERYPNRKEPE